jgi:hypothetical protein
MSVTLFLEFFYKIFGHSVECYEVRQWSSIGFTGAASFAAAC